MTALLVIVAVLVVLALYVIGVYNSLITQRMQTKEAWSTIETQLKRRYDLIPNLIETVKGYAKHESKTLENVINARNMAMSVKDASVQKEQYENMLTGTLKSLFALSENYPDLKANQNFMQMQQELTDTEDKIQATRQFYNTTVMSYNTAIALFPKNIIAGWFHFTAERFFELEESEKESVRKAVKVQF
jgi:LemA protein